MKTTRLPPLLLQAWHLAPCRMASHPTPEGSSRLRNLLEWHGRPANRSPTLTCATLPQPLLPVSQIYETADSVARPYEAASKHLLLGVRRPRPSGVTLSGADVPGSTAVHTCRIYAPCPALVRGNPTSQPHTLPPSRP